MENNFGERLKELRLERKLGQVELATKTGLSKSMISAWELGKSDITLSKAIILAEFFGVSIDYLAGKED